MSETTAGLASGPLNGGTVPPPVTPQAAAVIETRISPWRFLQYALGYWRGSDKRSAWTWTLLAIGLILITLAISVGINHWNRLFFDSLEKKQGDRLLPLLGAFAGLIVLGAMCASAMVRCRMSLQVSWRAWLTRQLTAKWLDEQRFYRLAITDDKGLNPEYRLADDVRLATEPVVDLAIGFINSLLSAVAFVSILFTVGGAITIPLGGQQITIPGYIAVAAVLYAFLVSSLMMFIGNPLVGKVERKNEAEAQFRHEMNRVRENAETIALVKGDADEKKRLSTTFERTVASWKDVIVQNARLTYVLNASAFFAPVVPLLLATPKYLSGAMTLGEVMQVAAAFMSVLGALNWFTDNYVRLAEWAASARRVDELYVALELVSGDERADKVGPIKIESRTSQGVRIENLSIAHRDGRVMIADAELDIAPGERILLGGESGTGKSTLVRAIAGLWPWGEGRILLPADTKVAFVPERTYIPQGTLRDVLAYPDDGQSVVDAMAVEALQAAGLGHISDRLDKVDRWEQVLSGGERQRLAVARLLLQRPQVIVMDEATAALDVDTEHRLLTLLFEALPDSTVISVGQREGLQELHTRTLSLTRHHTGARITQTRAGKHRPRWNKIKNAAAKTRNRLKGMRILRRNKKGQIEEVQPTV